MSAPPITPVPLPTPNPNSQSEEVFNAAMQAWVDWTVDFSSDITNFGVYLDENVVTISNSASAAANSASEASGYLADAETAANLAAATANMLGTWTAYGSAAITAFQGVIFHDSKFYVPIVNLADASSVEPGTDANTWFDYTSSVSAGDVVSGPTDTTGTRLTNVAWLVSRGIGGIHDATTRTLTLPSDIAGLGFISGECDGMTIGVPTFGSLDMGTLIIEAQTASAASANAVTLRWVHDGLEYIKQNTNATTWGDWTTYRIAGETIPVADGGTGASNATSARANLNAAASGAVTGNGNTMTSGRILGRTTAGTGAIQELTGGDVRDVAGISTGSGSGTYSGVTYTWAATKIDGKVSIGITLSGTKSGSSNPPAGFIPSAFRPTGIVYGLVMQSGTLREMFLGSTGAIGFLSVSTSDAFAGNTVSFTYSA